MANRTTSLDSKDLEVTIEVLSSAAHALQLTRFQRLSYWALMVSIDVAIVVAVAIVSLFILAINGWFALDLAGLAFLIIVAFAVFGLSLVVWIVLLALNIPLFRKASRERARLKELGLDSLSQSLSKESQRSRWRSRAHGALIIVIGVIFLLMTLANLALSREWDISDLLFALYCVASAGLLFCAQYLRNQREWMDLTASAEKLRKSLQSLQQRAGEARVVSVPSDLLEQTATIESAQISKERKEAILQSVATRPTEYAIAFGRDAVEQRSTLGIADRVELEDLVWQLGTDGNQLESRSGPVDGTTGADATLWSTTKSKRVAIEYVIDQASRSIRIIGVRYREGSSQTALNGTSHA